MNGSDGVVYGLSTRDGSELWPPRKISTVLESDANDRSDVPSSSFLVVDNLAVVMSVPTIALDLSTGNVAWTADKVANSRNNSAVVWEHEGQKYVICNAPGGVSCLDARDGRVLWTEKGPGYTSQEVISNVSTPAVAGDMLVVQTFKLGLVAYKITPEKAQKVWSYPFLERGASPIIHDGYVYNVGAEGRAVCVRLADGNLAWKGKPGSGGKSRPRCWPTARFFATVDHGNTLVMLKASPERFQLLSKARKMDLSYCVRQPSRAVGFTCGKVLRWSATT